MTAVTLSSAFFEIVEIEIDVPIGKNGVILLGKISRGGVGGEFFGEAFGRRGRFAAPPVGRVAEPHLNAADVGRKQSGAVTAV